MDKKLPNVYAVPIEKKLHNNEEISTSMERKDATTGITINEINELFASSHHVYKTKVKMTTTSGVKVVEVVGQTKNSLLTLDGERIPYHEILDIKKV